VILDGHVHVRSGPVDQDAFLGRLHEAGLDGSVLISQPPASFGLAEGDPSNALRLDDVLAWTARHPRLFPFYWIDPLEDDACEQVATAVERGVSAFKVICNRFHPWHERALEVFRAIACAAKPILFHSGILWDGRPSARYNRPGGFEALLEVVGLRFCLAHVSWPWCDELIAVYGKFQNAHTRRPELSAEMFVDVTPGTPRIYREEVLTKLFTVGYDVRHNVIFGSDGCANDYGTAWVRDWIEVDNGIYDRIGLDRETRALVYAGNLLRFVGATTEQVQHAPLRPGA